MCSTHLDVDLHVENPACMSWTTSPLPKTKNTRFMSVGDNPVPSSVIPTQEDARLHVLDTPQALLVTPPRHVVFQHVAVPCPLLPHVRCVLMRLYMSKIFLVHHWYQIHSRTRHGRPNKATSSLRYLHPHPHRIPCEPTRIYMLEILLNHHNCLWVQPEQQNRATSPLDPSQY